jgi:hypothetical protein
VTPETAAIPVAVTAADLAVRLNMPERTLRRKAREFGTCRILGRAMIFLPEDVSAFMSMMSVANVDDDRKTRRKLAEQRAYRIMLGVEKPAPTNYGHIYYVAANDRVKIGFAKNVKKRLAALSTTSPVPLVLLASHRGSQKKEREIHRLFAEYRLTGEWFRLDGELKEHIQTLKPSTEASP